MGVLLSVHSCQKSFLNFFSINDLGINVILKIWSEKRGIIGSFINGLFIIPFIKYWKGLK
jgi:hypothetical protein